MFKEPFLKIFARGSTECWTVSSSLSIELHPLYLVTGGPRCHGRMQCALGPFSAFSLAARSLRPEKGSCMCWAYVLCLEVAASHITEAISAA